MTVPDYFRAEAFEAEPDPVKQLPEERQHRGQARMAYRLAAAYGQKLMYVRGIGWHVWDGQRWAEDEKDEAKAAVLAVLRQSLADSLNDPALRTDVRKCESSAGVNGVLDLAASIPTLRVPVSGLDADPYLLNCANGTLDLRTRELRPHDPADRITRIARGAYDPGADKGQWDRFLETVLPNAEERAYLQRVIGQAVYGRVREHLFPVLTGTGANGKGTAYGAICNAFGDYSAIIDPKLLMAGDHKGGGPELMVLRGTRFVVGSETEEGRRLDAATMKRLTGGDELTARKLYHEPVTWLPTHQLAYVTNYLPQVKGNDPAVWRRLRVIPFTVVIPDSQRDTTLPERLELAADGILTWAVNGWFDYEDRGGMDEPENVRNATAQYQTDSDSVKRFVEEQCVTGPYAHARSRDLFTAWASWAAHEGAEQLSEKSFAKELDRLGFESAKTRAGMIRKGISLRAEEPEDERSVQGCAG